VTVAKMIGVAAVVVTSSWYTVKVPVQELTPVSVTQVYVPSGIEPLVSPGLLELAAVGACRSSKYQSNSTNWPFRG
jgi:hypothetical protein